MVKKTQKIIEHLVKKYNKNIVDYTVYGGIDDIYQVRIMLNIPKNIMESKDELKLNVLFESGIELDSNELNKFYYPFTVKK